MSKITQLATGRLNSDQLTIELVRPADLAAIARTVQPAMVRIVWPLEATTVNAREFSEIAAVAARLFATASTELSRIHSRDRGLL